MEFDDDFPVFECPNCEGRGDLPNDEWLYNDEDELIMVTCPVCRGTGVVE